MAAARAVGHDVVMLRLRRATVAFALVVAACSDEVSTTPCAPGDAKSCACTNGDQGAQVCNEDGSAWGTCVCDGSGGGSGATSTTTSSAGGAGGGLECAPGEERPCYDGPPATEDVGTCHGGTQICQSTKLWGDCLGQVLPSTDLCVSPEDEDCDGAPPTCPTAWQALLGDEMNAVNALDLAVGPDDSVFVAGQFFGSVVLGGQTYTAPSTGDGIVVKLSPQGDVVWVAHLKGLGTQVAQGVAVSPTGEVAVVGYFLDEANFGFGQTVTAQGDGAGFLWVLDDAGVPQWVDVFDGADTTMGSYELLNDVAYDSTGNLAVTGYYNGLIDLGGVELPLGGNTVLASIAPDDTLRWFSVMPTNTALWPQVAVDAQDRVLLTADNDGQQGFDFGSGLVTYSGFVARFDTAGVREAVYTYQAGPGLFGYTTDVIAPLPGGGARLTHMYQANSLDLGGGDLGPHGAFVLDLDDALQHAASYGLGSQGGVQIYWDAVAPNGASVLAGQLTASLTVGTTTLTPNPTGALLVRTDASGTPVDGLLFGGPNTSMSFMRAAFDSSGSVVAMGSWYGNGVDIGFGTLPPGGGQSFVVRLDW